ncbi:unnamed protein product [Paramecium pentaurelia]|uniref:Uncharacterized protein n=1 Tax=Paramecium pentaurelia TaxID=43138 RepID=A0A8S1TYV5_9CILI|nr:unnamed protein product [Paramecium pentaurelia]
MQNNNFRRPYFSVHNIPQTSGITKRSRIIIKKNNIKLKNINVPKLERSLSVPHNMKFFYRMCVPIQILRTQQHQPSIKDSLSPTRLSKIRTGRNTLKFSEYISNELSPAIIVSDHNVEDQVKEVQKRKSCDCSECGKQSLFQRETMNYGVQINHLMKEQESAINKFKRSIRKQQTLLFPQYLNTPKNSTSNENLVEEIQIVRDDIMIKSFAHRPTLSSLVFEEQVLINKQSPINLQSRIKHSYFESFLLKQQKLINSEKQQFSRQTGLFESLHKKNNFSNKNTQMHTPTVLTPRSPASSFIKGFPSQSPVKRNNKINVYLQPQKSKFFKNQNRITTLPEVHQ